MIALDDLRRDRFRAQSKFGTDEFFHAWIQMLVGADSARYFPDRHVLDSALHAQAAALDLIVKHCELEPECRRLCVDAMRATNDRRVLELHRASSKRIE